MEDAPVGQFLEVPDHPGVTFYKVEHSACPGFRPITKRSWTLAALDRVEEERTSITLVILIPCRPGMVEFAKVEAIVTHPQAFLPKRRKMQLVLQTGKKAFHAIERKEHASPLAIKPGLRRLLNGSSPAHISAHS